MMVDIGVAIEIRGRLADLAHLADFLRDLDARGIHYSVTLSAGGWKQTYISPKEWRDAIRSPTFGLPPEEPHD